MKKFLLSLVFLAGCATAQPLGANVRRGRGYWPLCHEWHEDAQMRWAADYEGKTFRFCDPNCRAAFLKDPEKSMKDARFNPPPGPPPPKGPPPGGGKKNGFLPPPSRRAAQRSKTWAPRRC